MLILMQDIGRKPAFKFRNKAIYPDFLTVLDLYICPHRGSPLSLPTANAGGSCSST